MKISTKGRYALRFMVDLAQNSGGECVSLKDASRRQGISIKYLEQIVAILVKEGLIRSIRGNQGGYMLAKTPSEYTVGEILRSVEGNLVPVACLENQVNLCPRKNVCPTIGFWKGLQEVVNKYVDSYTLEDLAKVPVPEEHLDFII
ncbi:MAG: Rrf2 family transcriptional regulator [Clostridiaceae bacterium]|nr:Rrf2 family transcriptional regulator [Clostridiaceae bacterium]